MSKSTLTTRVVLFMLCGVIDWQCRECNCRHSADTLFTSRCGWRSFSADGNSGRCNSSVSFHFVTYWCGCCILGK